MRYGFELSSAPAAAGGSYSVARTTRSFSGLQGLPAHTIHAGIDFVTRDRAPITAPSPIVTPGEIRHPDAIQACDPI